ncbi:hypothetical protein Ac2012v2_002082 [Leucoagaricus gongylophorus]
MDKSASWTVLQGTLSISALSATTIGLRAIFKGHEHPGFLASSAALNSGITATTFFALREYIVSPVLVHTVPLEQYERRRRQLGISQNSLETDSSNTNSSSPHFSSIRNQKILDSALSGMATGGLLRGLKCMSTSVFRHN